MADDVVMACDCDLRRIHCWCSVCGKVCQDAPDTDYVTEHWVNHVPSPQILFEIASPVSAKRGGESSAIMYNLAKWSIFNVATASWLHWYMTDCGRIPMLVAPSNIWTKGYDLKTRHALAKCTAKQKDLRECEAMIWFYRHNPEKWMTLNDYLEKL